MINWIRSLRQHQGFMKYFTNTSWLFAEKILRMSIGLFVSVWVARYLGPEQYGLYSYVLSFVGLFAVFATLGLDSIVVKELVKDEKNRDIILGTAFRLKQFGALLMLSIVGVAILFVPNDRYTNVLIFIIASIAIFQSFNIIDFYFQSVVKSKYVVKINLISLAISSAVKITLILLEAPLVFFAIAALFDSVVIALGLLYIYVQNGLSYTAWSFNMDMGKNLLKQSWPLILSGMAVSIYMKIDQIMIKEMMNTYAVGQYAAAVRISEALYFIPVLMASSLFPAIVTAKKVSQKLYIERLQKLYALIVWVGIAIAVPLTFLSGWLIDFLYGAQYAEAGDILMIHIWSGILVGLSLVKGKWQVTESLTKYHAVGALSSAAINVAANLVLIPKYGGVGAALGTLIAQFSSGYLINYLFTPLRSQLLLMHRAFNPVRIFR